MEPESTEIMETTETNGSNKKPVSEALFDYLLENGNKTHQNLVENLDYNVLEIKRAVSNGIKAGTIVVSKRSGQKQYYDVSPIARAYTDLEKEKNNLEKRLDDVYTEKAVFFQLLVALALKNGMDAGIRSVGKQDPDWPVFAIKLDENSEVACHIKKADVFKNCDYPSYQHAWKYEKEMENHQDKETYYKFVQMFKEEQLDKETYYKFVQMFKEEQLDTIKKFVCKITQSKLVDCSKETAVEFDAKNKGEI